MDEEEIKLPEFDENAFKEKERRKAKTSIISFLFGIIIALICRFLWVNMDVSIRWALTFIFALASIGFLWKILQILHIDIMAFGKKEWLGSIAFYFFTWLAFFVLFINPPFYDASPPEINVVVLPSLQEINENVSIIARITDNVGVKEAKINLSGEHLMNKWNGVYSYNYSSNKDTPFKIVAIDKNNHEAIYEGMLHFRKNVIYVEKNEGNIDASHEIKIWVMKNISMEKFRVFYKINGHEVNATYNGESGNYYIYKTAPSYEGWKANAENKMRIYAETIHYFPGIKTKFSAYVVGGEYKFITTNDSNIGQLPSPVIKGLPTSSNLRTPGFELLAVVIAFAIILWRRKKK